METSYRPYEELTSELSGETLRLSTPWTDIEARIPASLGTKVAEICRLINAGERDGEGVSGFLASFKDHYVAYSLPRSLPLEATHCTASPLGSRLGVQASPADWLNAFVPAVAPKIDLAGRGWNLDVRAVLAASRVGADAVFDPASAYRAILRWALKTVHEPAHAAVDAEMFALLEELRANDEDGLRRAARYYLRQYHYVTSNSFDCLVPAITTMPYAEALVRKLAREEHGHGSFTDNSLRRIGVTDPTSVPLGPTVVALMGMLGCAAHLNGLAFSCLFNLFELPGEQDADPLAELLERSGLAPAAQGIAAHFKFNKDGAHFTNGICLVENMLGVNEQTVLEACRMAELHFLLHENASREVMAYARRRD